VEDQSRSLSAASHRPTQIKTMNDYQKGLRNRQGCLPAKASAVKNTASAYPSRRKPVPYFAALPEANITHSGRRADRIRKPI
jgi:hypothetical protein